MDVSAPLEPEADAEDEDAASVSMSDDRLTAALAALVRCVQQRAGTGAAPALTPAALRDGEPDIR